MKSLIAVLFRNLFKLPPLKGTYFGFYTRVFKPLALFKGVSKQVRYKNKFRLQLDIADWIQQNLYFLDAYENTEIAFVERYLKPGDVFIDVGANIGLYSLVASDLVGPAGKVFAFEPLQKNHLALQKHLQLNNLQNVVLEKLAVSDRAGSIQLHLNEQDGNNGMATAFSDTYTFSETVPMVALDEYFNDQPAQKVSLIKIDIEGGEFPALKGMKLLLQKHQPAILMEMDPKILAKTPFRTEDLEAFLANLGYRKYFIKPAGTLTSEKPAGYLSHNYVFACRLPGNLL